MVMVSAKIILVMSMMGNGNKVNDQAKVFSLGLRRINIQDNGLEIKEMVKEFLHLIKEMYIMVDGKMICAMVKD